MTAKRILAIVLSVLGIFALSGCAALGKFGGDISRELQGINATMTTYNQDGQIIDQISGNSFNIQRDDRFDSRNSEGGSNKDSSVLLISLGDSHISHVGSTMVLAENGLEDIYQEGDGHVFLDNTEPGTPFLNTFLEKNRNMWSGKSKIIMVRSQDGDPIAIYSGDNVEIFGTDIPSSTQLQIDGQFMLVYRADYTIFDSALLVE